MAAKYLVSLCLAWLLMTALVMGGCGDSAAESTESETTAPAASDPGAQPLQDLGTDLWQQIMDEDYATWAKAPDFTERRPAEGPHGDEILVYVNDIAQERIINRDAGGMPEGAILVKDIFQDGSLNAVALMLKTAGGKWYWAEYHADGAIIVEGLETAACAGCHSEGKDSVLSFEVP